MHRIICEMYNENVIAIRTCANWFKWFKNYDYVYTASLIRFNNIRSFTADQLQLLHSSEE